MVFFPNFRDLKKPTNTVSRREGFSIATIPCELIAYLAINTFGLSMIYPGSVKLLQKFMSMYPNCNYDVLS